MSSALTDLLPHPIVQAPMAGGVAVPRLAAAVSEAGGLGFLAAGYKTADGMYQEIKQLRGLTGLPFGINLFMPQPETADPAAVDVYAHQLAGEASWYETELGDPDSGRDDGYDAKLAVLLDNPVPVVSFHFGVPAPEVLEALRRAGTVTLATATTPAEARAVERAGADAVIAQGVEAGGHQGTHRDAPEADGSGIGLLSLVAQVRETVSIPVIAAGGIMRGSQIAAALAAGADAVQLGTAFVATHESGAHELHKRALTRSGGHQGTHRDAPEADGSGIGLLSLVAQVRETVSIPVIAAGGIMRGSQIAAALAAGADAVQLGTAFVATHESGAHELHKRALTDP